MMKRRGFLPGVAALLAPRLAAGAGDAATARLDITPTGLALGSEGESAVCTVDNYGGTSAAAQIRVKAWRQAGGLDVLEDTAAVAASPPFMSVDPGGQQIVRVVNLAAAPGPTELAFRVLLDQVPMAGQDDGPGVHLLMAFSLPLFVAGVGGAPARLQAGFAATPSGVVLRVVNTGDEHARLVDAVARDESGRVLFQAAGLAGYVLGRSLRDLPTRLRAVPAAGGVLSVGTQTGPVTLGLVRGL